MLRHLDENEEGVKLGGPAGGFRWKHLVDAFSRLLPRVLSGGSLYP